MVKRDVKDRLAEVIRRKEEVNIVAKTRRYTRYMTCCSGGKIGRKLVAGATVASVAIGLAACGNSSAHPSAAPTTVKEKVVSSEVPKHPVIGMTVYGMSGYESLSKPGVMAEAKALGDKLIWDSAHESVADQISQVEDFITEHVNAIIVDPVESDSLNTQLKEARAAGISVVTTNVPVYAPGTHPTGEAALAGNSPYSEAYVGPDDVLAGEHEMEAMARALHGKGNIVEIQGPLGQAATTNRTHGIAIVLKRYPSIHLLAKRPADWSASKAYTVMSGFWSAFGHKIDGIVSENDNMAIGANRVLAEHGLEGKIPVVGIDGIQNGMRLLMHGDEIESNLQDGMLQEGEAVWVANRIIHHESYPKVALGDMPELTPKNVRKYYNQMFVHHSQFLKNLPSIIAHDMKTGDYTDQ